MKALFTSFLTCIVSLAVAQNEIISDNFEGDGTIDSWYADACEMELNFENPFQVGINTSAGVLRYADMGGQYANIRFNSISDFDWSTGHSFTLKIYVPADELSGTQNNQVSLKLQDRDLQQPWTTQCEIIKNIVLDQWQELTFDFANDAYLNFDAGSGNPINRDDLSRVVLQVNGENNNDVVVAYIDDFAYDGLVGYAADGYDMTQLVWQDEFDTDGPVDPTKWHHQTQLPNSWGWFNEEQQHYTDRVDNSFVEDGALHIVAKRENFTDQGLTTDFTSARLNSKFSFKEGRVEVRAKLPQGPGTWPAIWTLGKNIIEHGAYFSADFGDTYWPACGEIDIMEHWGANQNNVRSSMHTPSSFGGTINTGGTYATNVADDFHIYALEWTPEEMRFSVDGYEYYTYRPNVQNDQTWPFDTDQYLILNVAMAGFIDASFVQSEMVIDYIRVYEEMTFNIGHIETEPSVLAFPNPIHKMLNVRCPMELVGKDIVVISASGQILDKIYISEAETRMDFSKYSPGIYFLKYNVAGKIFTKKVVKN